MAEIKFNTLYDQMSGANQDFYDDTFTKYYNPDQAWTDQKNVLTMKTLPNQSTPDFNAMRTAYDQGAQSKTLGNFNWGNLVGMGSADAAMPSDAERAAINNSGVMGAYRPNMRDISGEVGEYGNTSGFDLSNMNMDNPDAAIGPIMNFKDAPIEANEIAKGLYRNNPRFGPIDMWKNQGGDETTRRFPGILGMLQSLGDKFQRPEAKQKEFEAYEASMNPQGWGDFGDYRGNIWEGSGGNKINVVDPGTGTTILQNKNFDSMFGSKSVEEMIAKKEAWARQRRAKGKEYLSTDMNAWLDAIDKGKGGADQTPKGPSTYDRGTFTGPHPDTPTKSPAEGGWHPGVAQGGYMRSRYNQGGRVGILSVF